MTDPRASTLPALEIKDLNVYYGASHALQGVDLHLEHGVLSVVGRNGMGKTTLCKAVMGLVPAASGTISFRGQLLNGKTPSEIARLGIGYVPQERRLWRSLSVDEHLQLVAGPGGPWSIERIYDTFPRLAERKGNGGAQLSGGEQQMLAISRALLLNPKLLVMDEPTEGLAPVIVSQVEEMLLKLAAEGEVDILVIEQNIAVATRVSENVSVMVNGQVNRTVRSSALAADRDLQQRLLGVGQHAHDEDLEVAPEPDAPEGTILPYEPSEHALPRANRWSSLVEVSPALSKVEAQNTPGSCGVIVIGAFDRFREDLNVAADRLKKAGHRVTRIDIALASGFGSSADVSTRSLAAWHPRGAAGIFDGQSNDPRSGLVLALQRYLQAHSDVTGVLALFDLGEAISVGPAVAAAAASRPVMLVGEAGIRDLTHDGAENLTVFNAYDEITRRKAVHAAAAALVEMLADEPALPIPADLVLISGPASVALTRMIEGRFAGRMKLMCVPPNRGGIAAARAAFHSGAKAAVDLDQSDFAEALIGQGYATVPDRSAVLSAPGRRYVSVLCGGSLHYQQDPETGAMRLEELSAEQAERVGQTYAATLSAVQGDVTVIVPTVPANGAQASMQSGFLKAFQPDPSRKVISVSGGPLDAAVLQEVEHALAPMQNSGPAPRRYVSAGTSATSQISRAAGSR